MILDHLERHALSKPHAIFLSEAEEILSFGELFERVTRLAARLRAEGVRKGDRVALYIERRTRHLAAYLAAMTLGAISVHLYAQRKPAFVAFAAAHTGACLVVSDIDELDSASLPCPLLRYPEPARLDLAPVWPGERHEVAYMMFTSGTTGTPKAVMTTHANLDFVTRTLIEMAGMTKHDRELIVLPLGSTGGLGHFHANLTLGNPTTLMPYFFGTMDDADLHHLLDTVESEGITGFLATPGMLARLADSHREALREKGRGLRYLLANAIPIREALVRDLLTLLPDTRFHTYYGLTEASRCVHHCYNDTPSKIASAGRPNPGVEIRIDAPTADGVGEVLIKGPNVMAGYWEMGEHGIDPGGWFRSGDLGRLDADGYLTIHGRIKENIRVDGLDCLPREMEDHLLRHPEVADCAIVGLPDPKTHQRVAAAIVPVPGADLQHLPSRLRAYCAEHLEFYKVPSTYAIVATIPRSDLGKIQREEVIRQLEEMTAKT